MALEDITRVENIILQHLPVFLQEFKEGSTDSQLVNSVYCDNYAMELYHGRLEKTSGAIALRLLVRNRAPKKGSDGRHPRELV